MWLFVLLVCFLSFGYVSPLFTCVFSLSPSLFHTHSLSLCLSVFGCVVLSLLQQDAANKVQRAARVANLRSMAHEMTKNVDDEIEVQVGEAGACGMGEAQWMNG